VSVALPLGNKRLFFSGKYLWEYPEKDEYISIMSSKGNDDMAKEYMDKNKITTIVGKTIISASWLKPIRDEHTQEVIGT
jgi:hypothetical protein